MGGKQTKPMVDVHLVQQKLARSELVYLKNLFLCLVQSASNASSTAATTASSPSSNTLSLPSSQSHLNQSLSSSALANPSNLELMSLRLPKASVLHYLLLPSFPGLSSGLLERFFQIFDYNAYGVGLDYSEYLVMMWTLWYGSPTNEELNRFLFTLFDLNGSGKVGRKEYRKVAQILLEEYSIKTTPTDATSLTGSKEKSNNTAQPVSGSGSSGVSGADGSREYLGTMFDFYFHLALYLHDRDHDKLLSLQEFANFSEEDLLLSALIHGRQEPRQAKQRVRELLGVKGEELLPNATLTITQPPPKRLPSSPIPSNAANGSAPLSSSSSSSSVISPSPPVPPSSSVHLSRALTRNFLGDLEVEETTGSIWRQQKRATIKNQVRRNMMNQAGSGGTVAAAQ